MQGLGRLSLAAVLKTRARTLLPELPYGPCVTASLLNYRSTPESLHTCLVSSCLSIYKGVFEVSEQMFLLDSGAHATRLQVRSRATHLLGCYEIENRKAESETLFACKKCIY